MVNFTKILVASFAAVAVSALPIVIGDAGLVQRDVNFGFAARSSEPSIALRDVELDSREPKKKKKVPVIEQNIGYPRSESDLDAREPKKKKVPVIEQNIGYPRTAEPSVDIRDVDLDSREPKKKKKVPVINQNIGPA
ncbi:hypothetical protein FA95DRAFT_126957 [Auriscalpium vulgare]|uniref:Uncharacterized protein n=1 Tax=Auriscalpium vulgare TaxID=40419 RepID=A0ACB8RN92_9AGAM|nr:hypothetical protein FA95DRAFT_126957 [Auriscalpium vulgare]